MTPAEKLIIKTFEAAYDDEFDPVACVTRTANLLGISRERVEKVVKEGKKRG